MVRFALIKSGAMHFSPSLPARSAPGSLLHQQPRDYTPFFNHIYVQCENKNCRNKVVGKLCSCTEKCSAQSLTINTHPFGALILLCECLHSAASFFNCRFCSRPISIFLVRCSFYFVSHSSVSRLRLVPALRALSASAIPIFHALLLARCCCWWRAREDIATLQRSPLPSRSPFHLFGCLCEKLQYLYRSARSSVVALSTTKLLLRCAMYVECRTETETICT